MAGRCIVGGCFRRLLRLDLEFATHSLREIQDSDARERLGFFGRFSLGGTHRGLPFHYHVRRFLEATPEKPSMASREAEERWKRSLSSCLAS